jgi:transketolase
MENLLQTMMGHQSRQQEQIDKHTAQIEKQSAEIDKQNAGIRDLIVVSRTILNSIQEFKEVQRRDHDEWSAQMKALRDAQAVTDEKLNILIDTVDRIIRRRDSTA